MFCGTAVALAEAQWSSGSPSEPQEGANRRRHERTDAGGRTLRLLIDGSPQARWYYLIGQRRRRGPQGLRRGSTVLVRFEGGILVPATVKWADGEQIGLAFTSPVLLDTPPRTDPGQHLFCRLLASIIGGG